MLFAFKKIVLSIIPYGFARALKKQANLHYILFGPSRKNIGTYLVNERPAAVPWYGMEDSLGPGVMAGFKDCYKQYNLMDGFVRKYILEVENCILEPVYGWAILPKDDTLVFDSISNNSWRESYHPGYINYKRHKDTATVIEEAVVINMIRGGEDNYWHFIHDLLGQVSMAEEMIKKGMPFIISKNLSEKSYFRQAIARSKTLSTIQWITRDEEYFHLKKAWFLQPMPNSNEQFFKVRELLEVPDGDVESKLKIFLTRSSRRIRFLKNAEVIEGIARKHGFDIVDTDGLSLDDQVELFSKTRYLAGIHGAGLTNLFFRKNAPLTLLELLPGDYIQPHYFWLCKGMGHDYDCIAGTASAFDTSFEIDPLVFENKLTAMLAPQKK